MGPMGRKACPILGVGAGRRPFFMGKAAGIGFPAREKSMSGYWRLPRPHGEIHGKRPPIPVGCRGQCGMPVPRGARRAGRRARRAPGGGGLPIRRHRAPVAAVPPRYVAEVGLYARFPVHVQLPDHVVAHGRLLPKDLDLLGSSVGPRAVVELVKMRWRDWRAYGGANGQSALAEMAVFAVAPATAPGSRAAAWRSWPAATSARCPLSSPRSGLVVETPPQGWAARARR